MTSETTIILCCVALVVGIVLLTLFAVWLVRRLRRKSPAVPDVSTGQGTASSVAVTADLPAGAKVVVLGASLLQCEYALRKARSKAGTA